MCLFIVWKMFEKRAHVLTALGIISRERESMIDGIQFDVDQDLIHFLKQRMLEILTGI